MLRIFPFTQELGLQYADDGLSPITHHLNNGYYVSDCGVAVVVVVVVVVVVCSLIDVIVLSR